jgi:hypothetical protein
LSILKEVYILSLHTLITTYTLFVNLDGLKCPHNNALLRQLASDIKLVVLPELIYCNNVNSLARTVATQTNQTIKVDLCKTQ